MFCYQIIISEYLTSDKKLESNIAHKIGLKQTKEFENGSLLGTELSILKLFHVNKL